MKHPHRCLDCDKHFVLNRRCEQYVARRRCPRCGSFRIRYDDYERRRRLARRRQETCRCYLVAYPHRRGSTPFCRHHPTGPTDVDWRQQYMRATG